MCIQSRIRCINCAYLPYLTGVCVCVAWREREREGKKIALSTMDPKERNATIHSSDQTTDSFSPFAICKRYKRGTDAKKKATGNSSDSIVLKFGTFFYSVINTSLLKISFFSCLSCIRMGSEQTRNRTMRHLFYPSCVQGSWPTTTTTTRMQSSLQLNNKHKNSSNKLRV